MEEKYTLAKWLNSELSDVELKEFETTEDYLIYQKISKYSNQLTTNNFDQDKMLTKILESKKSENTKIISLFSKSILKIAAVFLLFFTIGYFYNQNKSETVLANNQQKTEFSLPDNSQIALNTGSTIEYKKNNWDSNRNLKLTGEAYFKVAKGKTFSVETDLGQVQVLGTQFNVNSKNNVLSVVCFEGKVKVKHNNKEVILNPSQTISFKDGKIIDNKSVSYSKPTWINNKFEYDNVNLNLILSDLEVHYKIKVDDNQVTTNKMFSGKMPTDDLEIAMKIIASTYQIKFNKTGQNNYVLATLE